MNTWPQIGTEQSQVVLDSITTLAEHDGAGERCPALEPAQRRDLAADKQLGGLWRPLPNTDFKVLDDGTISTVRETSDGQIDLLHVVSGLGGAPGCQSPGLA
jgi:hypothetical protein